MNSPSPHKYTNPAASHTQISFRRNSEMEGSCILGRFKARLTEAGMESGCTQSESLPRAQQHLSGKTL